MMFPIDYNGDVLNHNARVGVDGGIVESTDFLADFSEQTKRVNMPLLLDIYPNAAAAYSLRKLRTAYTGSAIRVRRSSDNTETDIGFNNAGDLDTSALATFVGNGNGFVSTWYDQSGNNRNATQTIQANQPIVVSGGTVYRDINGKVWIKGYGVSTTSLVSNVFTTIPQPFSTYTVLNYLSFTSPTVFPYAVDLANTTGNLIAAGFYNNHRNYAGANLYNTTQAITQKTYLYSSTFNTTNSLFSVNTNVATGNVGTISAQKITLFNAKNLDAALNGYLQEFIFYPTNQSPNRIGIETNINSYYRIYQQEALLLDYYPDAAAAYSLRKLRSGYTGSAIQVRRSSDNAVQNIGFDSNGGLDTTALTTFVGTGNTGFVTTWYDQSGNNYHALQTGTTNQPVIVSGGTLITTNSKPSLNFDGAGDTFTATITPLLSYTNMTTFIINNPAAATPDATTSILFGVDRGGATISERGISVGAATVVLTGEKISLYFSNSSVNSGRLGSSTYNNNANEQTLFSIFNLSSGFAAYKNNSFITFDLAAVMTTSTPCAPANTDALNPLFHIGTINGASNGTLQKFQEVIVYPSNQSTNRPLIEANINSYYNIYVSENDAQSFIDAAAITNSTQRQAINKLVYDLKAYGLWYKMKAIYPFVGGTAASHKFNLKDPRDVDGAFRLVFNGGWTHSATGALPNGTTGYADTRLNPNAVLQLNAVHLSVYNRSNLRLSGIIGSSDVSLTNALYLYPRYTNDREFTRMFSNSGPGSESLNSQGFWVSSRVSSTGWKVFRNNFLQSSYTVTSSNKTSFNTYIGAGNLNGTPEYGVGEFAFATIGDGLTDTEAANLYTAVQTFQTTLGRQV